MGVSVDDQIADLWDFDDPARSEARFCEAIRAAADAGKVAHRLALMTQQARACGLRKRFDEANAVLDAVERSLPEEPDSAMNSARVRLHLERGRLLNSSGAKEQAKPLFERAWENARQFNCDALAVDAAHMVAIAASSSEEALQWNRCAIELADSSSDPCARRWRGSLHNNLGWTYHDRGDCETAMHHFEQALASRREQNQPREVLIARWCIARCLRSVGRVEEALAQQMQLRDEWHVEGEKDGYVFEEIAECLLALGKGAQAKEYFAQAHELLKAKPWIEAARLERLAKLSKG